MKGVHLLTFVKYTLCSHCTQNCIFCTFWMLETFVLWRKIGQNFVRFVYLFCAISSKKTYITQEWLVIESWPTLRWITFLMLYRGVKYTLSFQWTNFGLIQWWDMCISYCERLNFMCKSLTTHFGIFHKLEGLMNLAQMVVYNLNQLISKSFEKYGL